MDSLYVRGACVLKGWVFSDLEPQNPGPVDQGKNAERDPAGGNKAGGVVQKLLVHLEKRARRGVAHD